MVVEERKEEEEGALVENFFYARKLGPARKLTHAYVMISVKGIFDKLYDGKDNALVQQTSRPQRSGISEVRKCREQRQEVCTSASP